MEYTFLFTDIEGSTRLWEAEPEPMRQAIATHDAMLRRIFAESGGEVFKTIGDAFCVCFDQPVSAVEAAIRAQLALQSEQWPTSRPIRVRIAIHHGQAEARDDDYFGRPLNRVARMLAAIHGSQIVVSNRVHSFLSEAGENRFRILALGTHRLKDLDRPEALFQVSGSGLPETFPPLRSVQESLHNLPVQLTSFFGREKEIADLRSRIHVTRLLTLCGAGGTGKTRLSLQVAAESIEHFPDGVWLSELATLSEESLVPAAVAEIFNVREEPGRTLTASIIAYLQTRKLLLLIDNCEHLLAASAKLIREILHACPGVRVLATSRAPLNVAGEVVYPLNALQVPDRWETRWRECTEEELMEVPAIQLFLDRARASAPRLDVNEEGLRRIAQICWRLDGIPLAIELAAVRAKLLSLDQIAARLDDRFRLLGTNAKGGLPHQQTLRALIDWSYDLLSENERRLLGRLAVFARGRTIDAVEAVCQGNGIDAYEILDLLGGLVDKSLVWVEEGPFGESRYVMSESVWDYARERLEQSGEVTEYCRRHLAYFADLVESAELAMQGSKQAEIFERFAAEHANFRLALEWAEEDDPSLRDGMRLGAALGRYWEVRSWFVEARESMTKLLARPLDPPDPLLRARLLLATSRLAWCQDDTAGAQARGEEALQLFEALQLQGQVALALAFLGFVAVSDDNDLLARERFDRGLAVAEEAGDRRVRALAQSGLGTLAAKQGDFSTARRLKEASLRYFREIEDRWVITLASWSLSQAVTKLKDYAGAHQLLLESIEQAELLGTEWIVPYQLEGVGDIASGVGDARSAARLYGAASVIRERFGLSQTPPEARQYQAAIDQMRNELGEADHKAAWNEGRGLQLAQAIRMARELPVSVAEALGS